MPVTKGAFGPLVGAIDEGTSSTRFIVFSANTSTVVASNQVPIKQICPREGWVEQDPKEILSSVLTSIEKTKDALQMKDIDIKELAAVGITNQRETTVMWDSMTGEPLHNAIVWLDARTAPTVEQLLDKLPNRLKSYLQPLCGLPISPYFSALKIRWLLDNVPGIREAIEKRRCLFGTIDTWIIWNLTGGREGGVHITDVTNASRTMLMNIQTLKWDQTLCRFFNIPMEILPKICSSSEIYGFFKNGSLSDIPISGCLGDQHAALLGQLCFKQGQAKSTYGTGCFLLYNTGHNRVESSHGLLTTVAWKLGNASPVYALEGSVAIAGAAINWLKDNVNLITEVSEVEELANRNMHTGDVYFIPAFSGLYAPYWRPDARGVICGITEDTDRGHIIRATLEAICFQTRDILEAMNKDCGIALNRLKVDGGMTQNNLLMQLQADLCGMPVARPKMVEITALGAAMAAGFAEGVKVWDIESTRDTLVDVFQPIITEEERDNRYEKWKMAVQRSFGWDTV